MTSVNPFVKFASQPIPHLGKLGFTRPLIIVCSCESREGAYAIYSRYYALGRNEYLFGEHDESLQSR